MTEPQPYAGRNVLVTGASGIVGSWLLQPQLALHLFDIVVIVDPGIIIEYRPQGDCHTQTSNQHLWVRLIQEALAAEFAEGDFGALRFTVHQHLRPHGDEIIPDAPLAQFKDPFILGIKAIDYFPG